MTTPIDTPAGAATGSPVGRLRSQPDARTRLVAFAHAGGGPRTFHYWNGALAPDVELWHVTLPGRAGRWREPFARDWPALIDELASAIATGVPAPVALLGHSVGALLAFEVARRLTAVGVPPSHLFVSGCRPPDAVLEIEIPAGDDELLRHVDRLYGSIPDAVRASREVLDHFLPILRADLELVRSYAFRAGTELRCPVTALAGSADPVAPASQVEGWARHTEGDFHLHVVPGRHFFLFEQEPAVLWTILSRLSG